MPKPRPPSLLSAFFCALLGIVIACMAKGAQLGWDGGRGDWPWLNALLGMVGGPLLLLLDGLAISGKGPPGEGLLALPWAGIGAVIGAIAGLIGNNDE